MAIILIIDDQPERRDNLFRELEKDGHRLKAVCSRKLGADSDTYLKYDMAIINLYPDAVAAWELQQEFKQRLPGFPVLLYMKKDAHAISSLKIAVKEILKEKASRPIKTIAWPPIIAAAAVIDNSVFRQAAFCEGSQKPF